MNGTTRNCLRNLKAVNASRAPRRLSSLPVSWRRVKVGLPSSGVVEHRLRALKKFRNAQMLGEHLMQLLDSENVWQRKIFLRDIVLLDSVRCGRVPPSDEENLLNLFLSQEFVDFHPRSPPIPALLESFEGYGKLERFASTERGAH